MGTVLVGGLLGKGVRINHLSHKRDGGGGSCGGDTIYLFVPVCLKHFSLFVMILEEPFPSFQLCFLALWIFFQVLFLL